jgi:hypothetical protein
MGRLQLGPRHRIHRSAVHRSEEEVRASGAEVGVAVTGTAGEAGASTMSEIEIDLTPAAVHKNHDGVGIAMSAIAGTGTKGQTRACAIVTTAIHAIATRPDRKSNASRMSLHHGQMYRHRRLRHLLLPLGRCQAGARRRQISLRLWRSCHQLDREPWQMIDQCQPATAPLRYRCLGPRSRKQNSAHRSLLAHAHNNSDRPANSGSIPISWPGS